MHQTTQSRMTSRKLQRGITLGETLLSMAIGAAVVVGAYTFYTKANSDVRAQQTADGISQIIVGIKERFGPLGGYDGVSAATLVANTIVPKTFKVTGSGASTEIKTPYGGDSTVTVAPVVTQTDSGTTYTVLIKGVPKEACLVIAARIDAASSGIAIGPDLTATTPLGTGTGENVKKEGGEMKPDLVVTQCGTSDTNGKVMMLAKSQ